MPGNDIDIEYLVKKRYNPALIHKNLIHRFYMSIARAPENFQQLEGKPHSPHSESFLQNFIKEYRDIPLPQAQELSEEKSAATSSRILQ